jgi:hypothetical protein
MRKTNPVPIGDRRRMSDGKNAWRKMTQEQKEEFLRWISDEDQLKYWLHGYYQPSWPADLQVVNAEVD